MPSLLVIRGFKWEITIVTTYRFAYAPFAAPTPRLVFFNLGSLYQTELFIWVSLFYHYVVCMAKLGNTTETNCITPNPPRPQALNPTPPLRSSHHLDPRTMIFKILPVHPQIHPVTISFSIVFSI